MLEHTSAFHGFPDDGIRIDPHMIRRVTSYDGAVLEQAHPAVHDVISPEVARTMVAMLEDVVNFGTGVGAKALGRPSGGKTGTTNDFTDAWYMGFTPQLTAGVWVGFDDKQSIARQRRNGRARRAADLARVHARRACRYARGSVSQRGAAGESGADQTGESRHARFRSDGKLRRTWRCGTNPTESGAGSRAGEACTAANHDRSDGWHASGAIINN